MTARRNPVVEQPAVAEAAAARTVHSIQHRLVANVMLPLVLGCVLFGAGGVASNEGGGGQAPGKAALPARAALSVTATSPHRTSWPVTLEASGPIAPWQEAVIGAQVGGYRLIEVSANVGDVVKRGQLLARIDPDLLRADEKQLEAGLAQAEATLAESEANSRRSLSLQDTGSVSKQAVLQAVTLADTSRAKVTSARALLAAKQLQLSYTDVVAPEDGTISARSATLGAVPASGSELFRLICEDRLEWRGELTASQLAQIAVGQRILLALPDGTDAFARVRRIAPSLDASSRLGMVYADIDDGSSARAGMYANGRVILAQSTTLVVPAASVVIRDGRNYVLTLISDGGNSKASLQAVTVGRYQDSEVEIVQGLAATEQIIVQGAGLLSDGDVVRVVRPMKTAETTSPQVGER